MTNISNKGNKINTQVNNSQVGGNLTVNNYQNPDAATLMASDWAQIIQISWASLHNIQDKIGGKVSLERTNEIQQIHHQLQQYTILFVLGKSGHGKSVLVKQYLQTHLQKTDKLIWIDALSVDSGNFSQYFHLHHNFLDLLDQATQEPVYLVVDGMDRFFQEKQMQLLSQVLAIAQAPPNAWKIIITCQQEDYDLVIQRLYQHNMNADQWKELTLQPINDTQLNTVVETFSPLESLLKHRHLRPLLRNLKYLDLLAFHSRLVLQKPDWASLSEMDLVDWIWQNTLESGEALNVDQGTRFLQQLAQKQADELVLGVPKADFEVGDLAPLPALKRKKLLTEKEDKLYFVHDLFGDWARYKLMRGKARQLKRYLLAKELLSPLWCKGIRLYGIHLLEKSEKSAQWLRFFNALDAQRDQEKIIQDLLLESIMFATHPLTHLEHLWELLQANEGAIFKRFLERFYHKATYPNQAFLAQKRTLGKYTVAEIAVYQRKLAHAYWPEVLHFLYAYIHQIKNIDIAQTAHLARQWLENTPPEAPYRKQAAKIGYYLAHHTNTRLGGKKEAYLALLAGVNELPNLVIDWTLKLCHRIKVETKSEESTTSYKPAISLIALIGVKLREATQWEDGPYEAVDEKFSEVCLDKGGLCPIIDAFPAIAQEILLALLIEEPEVLYRQDLHEYKLDIRNPRRWFPPFYTRGPFLYFLQTQPTEGLNFIIRLVNFATQQWATARKYEKEEITEITLYFSGAPQTYLGDQDVYFWFRDGRQASHALVSVLMALEKYLMDLIDQAKDVQTVINILLQEGNSVAFLGLLNSIGKYKEELYLGTLQPLLGAFLLYRWEMGLEEGMNEIERGYQLTGVDMLDKPIQPLAKEWHTLPHRKKSLFNVALLLNFNHSEIQVFFETVTKRWQVALANIEKDGEIFPYLTNLIAQCNLDNYLMVKQGNRFGLAYQEPKAITQKLAPVRKHQHIREKFFHLPYTYHQALENGTPYTLEALEGVWETVQEAFQLTIDPFPYISSRAQWIFGGCAVLVYHQQVWLESHPQYLEWITKTIQVNLEAYPYEQRKYEFKRSDIGYSELAFVTRIVAKLWVSDPQNKLYRKLLGLALMKGTYGTIQLLFKNIAKHYSWSSPDFIQVQNLLVNWCVGTYRHYQQQSWLRSMARIPNRYRFPPKNWRLRFYSAGKAKKHFDLTQFAQRKLKEFVNDHTEQVLINWAMLRKNRMSKRQHWHYEDKGKASSLKEPGIDTHLLMNAYASIPSPSPNTRQSDYTHLLLFWNQVVEQITFEWGEVNPECARFDIFREDFYNWALERLALTIFDITPENNPERYWKPLLAYGDQARDWLDLFLGLCFIVSKDRKDNYDRFFAEWAKMVAFAYQQNNWRYFSLWKSLLGFSDFLKKSWTRECQAFWQRAAGNILTWFTNHTTYESSMTDLADLLRTEAGEVLLTEGIGLIKQHLEWRQQPDSQEEIREYHSKNLETSLELTASYLWDHHHQPIINDPEVFAAFKAMVTYLVACQNAIGLELQERLVGGD